MNHHLQFLRLLFAVSWVALAGSKAPAQSSSPVQLQLYAGLKISGSLGTVYSIDYATDLAETNANNWHSLAFLQLPATEYEWFDSTAAATATRFYRAMPFGAPANMVFIPPGTFRM